MNEAEAARLKEMSKLGDGERAFARVRAVETYLRAQGGEGAEEIIANLRTARQVESFEKIMAANRSQRAAEPSPKPAQPPPLADGDHVPLADGHHVDEATFAKMSHGERWAYARQFDQGQFQPRSGDPRR
jgi:hypothetical protein